ncbi:MAG: general stress protein CsbD [Bacteroidota bacterium]|nr:general stress protein CsbD [Bacteroidota bacterium]
MATTHNPSSPFKGNWQEQKTKLMRKFPVLTDRDLNYEEGKEDEMLGRLQVKLGKTKEELRKIIAAL